MGLESVSNDSENTSVGRALNLTMISLGAKRELPAAVNAADVTTGRISNKTAMERPNPISPPFRKGD